MEDEKHIGFYEKVVMIRVIIKGLFNQCYLSFNRVYMLEPFSSIFGGSNVMNAANFFSVGFSGKYF